MGEFHRMIRSYQVEVMSIRMSMFSQIELIVTCALYPIASRSLLNSLPDLFLNIGNGCHRGRAAIEAEQVRGIGHDMDVGIVEAGDNGLALTVD
jgi:hypothetical protein